MHIVTAHHSQRHFSIGKFKCECVTLRHKYSEINSVFLRLTVFFLRGNWITDSNKERKIFQTKAKIGTQWCQYEIQNLSGRGASLLKVEKIPNKCVHSIIFEQYSVSSIIFYAFFLVHFAIILHCLYPVVSLVICVLDKIILASALHFTSTFVSYVKHALHVLFIIH